MIQAVWVEIPVKDLDRATKFYQALFELESAEISDDGVRRTATLFGDPTGKSPGISLNQTANFEPSNKGTLVYLDAGEELTGHLKRVEPAGGKVIEPKTSMGAAGYFASFLDTEGNLLALYSPS